MLSVMAGLILAVAVQDDAAQDLSKLCKKIVKCDSYTFELVTDGQGGGMFGGRMRGGRRGGQAGGQEGAQDAAPEPQKVVGQYKSGQPCHLKTGQVDAYKVGDATVYRQGESEWQLFDMAQMMRGARGQFGGRQGGQDRGNRGARGGDQQGGQQGGQRGGEQRGQQGAGRMSGMRDVMSVTRVQLPHEILAKLDGKFAEVKSTEKDGKLTYSATLTKEGAEAIGGMQRAFRRGRGGSDQQGPSFDYSGTIELALSKQGQIEKIVLQTTMSGSFGERSFERTTKRTVMIKNQGKTTYEVPEEALSKFEI